MVTEILVGLGLLDPYKAKVDQRAADFDRWDVRFEDTRLGADVQAAAPAEQVQYILAMPDWCEKFLHHRRQGHSKHGWHASNTYAHVAVARLKRKLPWGARRSWRCCAWCGTRKIPCGTDWAV